MACKFFTTAGRVAGCCVLFAASFGLAQQPAARFEISAFSVEGAPLLKAEDFTRLVAPFIGKQKTAADVQKAQQAVQQAYLDLGYCSVQVTLPKAEPDAGTVVLKLAQSPVPISRDCLPTVVLDSGTSPLPIAPGEVATRPLSSAIQDPAEASPPIEAPSRIARAPLKPLQDRPSPARSAAESTPATVAAPTMPETTADASVQTLTQVQPRAPPVTPAIPAIAAKPVVAAPTPVAPLAGPSIVAEAKPAMSQASKVESAAVVTEPVAPSLVVVAPIKPWPAPSAVAIAPRSEEPPVMRPEPVIAPVQPSVVVPAQALPMIESPRETVAAKPQPAQPQMLVERPLVKPDPAMIAVAPLTPEPARAAVEPVKPAIPVISAPVAVAPEPAVIAKPVPLAPSTIVQRPVEKTLVEITAAAPVVAQPMAAAETLQPTLALAPPPPQAPAFVPAAKPIQSAPPVSSPMTEASKAKIDAKPTAPDKPAVVAQIVAPKPTPDLAPSAMSKPQPIAIVPAPSIPVVEPRPLVASPAIIATAPPDLRPPPQSQPSIEAPKETTPRSSPVAVPPVSVIERVAEKPADVEVRPLAGAVAAAPEPREAPKPAAERAPVRPLQDRPVASAQEQAPRLADASEPKPAVKPPVVVVQAPAIVAPVESVVAVEPAAAPAALKFDIDRYLVEGNTLLSSDAIGKVLATYTGKQKDFSDVQRALEGLQVAYQKLGWGVVQVTLPEQELERGEVRFEVTETRIGKIEVQGNEYFSEANVRRSVPALKEGETPNSLSIARSLRVANESSVKQSQVSLKAGSKEGEVDATIKVVDDNPRKYSVSLDNTGTSNTGILRLGFGFQHSNLWDRDHQLTLQYITNPEHVNKVTVLGAGYHIPLYSRGDSIDFVLGYSDVDSGVVQQLFNVSGAGLIVLGRYNMNLGRIEDYEHKVTFGLDYKAFQSRVLTTSGVALVPDITLHPASIAYSGELRNDTNTFNFYTSLSYNAFEGGNDAAQSDFKASRGSAGGASAEYVIWRAGVNYQRLLPADWTFRFAANAQTSRNALVAGEQFGVGGANSVRGFNERVYSNDKGHQATFELITPDIAGKIGFDGGRLRLLAFYDTANLSRNFIQPGEQTGLGIDSVGLGLRLTFREKLSLRLDYAQVLHDGGQDSSLRDGRRNSNTFHASALFVY